MVSKNNRIERIEKDAEKQSHFGIRKLTIGAASVLLSTTLWLGSNANVTKADTNNDNGDLDQASEQTSTSTSSGISETEKVVVVKNADSTTPSTPKANTSNSHNNDAVNSTPQNNSERSADSTPTAESQATSEQSPDNTTDLEKAAQTQVEHAITNTQQSTPVTHEDNSSDKATKINQAAQAGKQLKKATDLSKVALKGVKTSNVSSSKADNPSDETEDKNIVENTNITIPETGITTFELTPKAENEAKIAANLYAVNFAQQNGFGSILDNIKKLNPSQVKQAIDQVKTNLRDPDVQKFANDLLTGKTGSLLIDGLKAKDKLTNSIDEMQNIIKQVTGTNDETKKDPTDPAQTDGNSDLISKLKDFKLPNIDPTKISGAVKDLSNNLKNPQIQNLINSLSSGNPIKIGMAAISAKNQIENSLNDVQSIAQQITGNKNAGASLDKLKDITKIDPEKALNAFNSVSSILQDPAIKNVMGDVVTGNTAKLVSDGIKAIPVITKNAGNLQNALQEITGDKNSGAILDKIKDLKLPNIDPDKLEKIAQDATNIAQDPAIQKLAKDLITGNTVGILPDIINAGKNGNLDNVKDIIQQVTGNTDSASWLDKLGKLNLPKVDMDQLNKIVQGISSTVKDPAVQQLAKDLISGNTANIIPDLIKAGPTLAKNFGNVQDIINKIIGDKGQQGDHTKPDTDHPTSWFDKFKNLIPSFTDEEKTAAKNAVNRAITNPGVSNLVMDVVTGNTPKLLIDVIHYGPSVLKDAYTSAQEIIKAVKDARAQKPDDKPDETKNGSVVITVHDNTDNQDLSEYTYTSGEEKIGTKVNFDKAALISKLQAAGYKVVNGDVNIPSEIVEGPTNVIIYVEKAEEPKPVEEKKGSLTVTVHDSESKKDLTQYTYASGEEKVGTKIEFDRDGLISKLQSAGYKVVNGDVNIPSEISEGPTNITIYVEKTEEPKPVEEKKGSLTVTVHDSDSKKDLTQYTYNSGEEKVGTKVEFDKAALINKLQAAGYKVINDDISIPSEIVEGSTNITIYVEKAETPKPVEEKKGSLTITVHDTDNRKDLTQYTYNSGEEKVGTKVNFDKAALISKLQAAGYKVVNGDVNIPSEIVEGPTNVIIYVEKAEEPKPVEEKKGSLTVTVHDSESKKDLTEYTYASGEEKVGTKVDFDRDGLITKLQATGYKVVNPDVNIPSEITEGTTNITVYVEKAETPKPVEEKKGSLTVTVHDSDSKQDLTQYTYTSGEEKVGTKINFDKAGLINKLQSAGYKVINDDINIPSEIVEGSTNITIYIEKAKTPKPVEEKKGSLTVAVHDSNSKQDLPEFTYNSGEEKVGTKVKFDKAGLINKLQSAGYKVINDDVNIPSEIVEGSTNITIYIEKAKTPKPVEEKKGSLTVTVHDSDSKQDLAEYTYNSGEEKVGTKVEFDKAALVNKLQSAGYKVINDDVNIPSEITEGTTNITVYVEKAETPKPVEEKKGSLTVTVHDSDSKQDLTEYTYASGEEKVGTKVEFDKAGLINKLQAAGYKVVNPDVNIPSEITEGTTNVIIYVEKAEEPKPVEEKKGSLTVIVHDSESKQDLAEYTYTSGEEKVGTKVEFDRDGLITKLQATGYKVVNPDVNIPAEIVEGSTNIIIYVEKAETPKPVEEKKGSLTVTVHDSDSKQDLPEFTYNSGEEKVGTKVKFDKAGLINKLQSAGYKVINADINIPSEITEGTTNITVYVEKAETPKPVEEKKGSLTVIVHDSDSKQDLPEFTYNSGEEKVGTKINFDEGGLINKLESAGYKVVNDDVNIPSEIVEGSTNIIIYVEKAETPKPVEEKKGSLTITVHDTDSKQDLTQYTYNSGEEKVGTKVEFDKAGLINKLQSVGYKVINDDVNIPSEITEGTTNITVYVEKAEEPKPVEEKKGSLTVTVHDSDSKQDLGQYTYTSGEEKVGTKVEFDRDGLISKLQSAGYKVINADVNIPSEISEGTTNITVYVEKAETPKPVEEKKGSLTVTVHDSDSKQDLAEYTYNSGEEKVGTKINFDKAGLINKLQSVGYKVVNSGVNIPSEISEGTTNITIYVEKATNTNSTQNHSESSNDVSGNTSNNSQTSSNNALTDQTATKDQPLNTSNENQTSNQSASTINSDETTSSSNSSQAASTEDNREDLNDENESPSHQFSDSNDETDFASQSSEQKSNDNYYDKNRAPHSLKGNNFANIDKEITAPSRNVISPKTEIVDSGNTAYEMNYKRSNSDNKQLPKTGEKDSDSTIIIGAVATSLSLLGLMGVKKRRED
ncbi:YSIRK-type signal peptide-containing protein [Lactobacillus intestinalis]|uniref:YSIRK-type signal peptide-containing protein n=1 Tax=Lactobacillus intestinalis TaxID=151781 RepID=UPI0025A9F775|nr:YSIRK-type signal peptide-containing protein [Lactobacillus intestinalis]